MSDSLLPHGLQDARLPCLSPTPGVHSNSCPMSRWCHPTISSSVVPLSSCLLSFPASGSLQISQFFTSGSQSTGVSALASVLPMNIQVWSPLGWTGWISLQSKGLSRVLSTPQFKSINSSALSFLYSPTLTSKLDYCKNHGFDYMYLSQLFNMLSRFVIAFLPRNNYLPIFFALESSAHPFRWQFRCHFSGESSVATEN